jgi:hypothetical protein
MTDHEMWKQHLAFLLAYVLKRWREAVGTETPDAATLAQFWKTEVSGSTEPPTETEVEFVTRALEEQ